jgi:hypothetical protein
MVQPHEVEAVSRTLSLRPAFDRLPAGMTADDMIGALKLAMLTESATDTYADTILTRAARYDAAWLGRFTRDIWAPDEALHHTPYVAMLESAGISAEEIAAEIARTRGRSLDYHSGDTPIHLTTYGMIQEYVTDNWHGLIADILRPTVPSAAHLAYHVKRRETIHTIWYRDMTALQLEANPGLLGHVAEAVTTFEMPGPSLVPEFDQHVPRWMPLMGCDDVRTGRDIVRMLYTIVGDTQRAGQLALRVAAERGVKIGPLTPSVIRAALDRLGGNGYGLVGEAVLEKVGLGYLYRDRRSTAGRPASLPSRVRGMLRRWLADQIDVGVDVGPGPMEHPAVPAVPQPATP